MGGLPSGLLPRPMASVSRPDFMTSLGFASTGHKSYPDTQPRVTPRLAHGSINDRRVVDESVDQYVFPINQVPRPVGRGTEAGHGQVRGTEAGHGQVRGTEARQAEVPRTAVRGTQASTSD